MRFVYILDSGAYSVWRKGQTIELDKYAKFVNENRDTFRGGVFNLDVIGSPQKSYENWIELRRQGADTIPVYHIEAGGLELTLLKKYMDKTDYIGLGAIAKLDRNSRMHGLDYVWKTCLANEDGTPRVRVHGLGLTDIGITLRYPWYSIDSTRTIALAAYGGILLPEITNKLGVSYEKLHQIAVSSQARDHTVGKTDSFFALPRLAQANIRVYCESLGYQIDTSLEGRKLNPKMQSRKKKDPEWVNGLEIPDEEGVSGQIGGINNLSNSWVTRFIFNLYTSNQFVEYWRRKGRTIRIYNVVGGGTVFDVFANSGVEHRPAARALVSYARMSTSFLASLKRVVENGTSEKKAA